MKNGAAKRALASSPFYFPKKRIISILAGLIAHQAHVVISASPPTLLVRFTRSAHHLPQIQTPPATTGLATGGSNASGAQCAGADLRGPTARRAHAAALPGGRPRRHLVQVAPLFIACTFSMLYCYVVH